MARPKEVFTRELAERAEADIGAIRDGGGSPRRC